MTPDTAGKLLESNQWTFAKTMPQNPHWYAVRKNWRGGDDEFDAVVMFIRQQGHQVDFKGRKYICWNYNGHRYWTMGSPLASTRLINRCKIEAVADEPTS